MSIPDAHRPQRAVIYVPSMPQREQQQEWEKLLSKHCDDEGYVWDTIARNPAQAVQMKLSGQVDLIVYPAGRRDDLLLGAEAVRRRRFGGVAIPGAAAALGWVREHTPLAGATAAAAAAAAVVFTAMTFTLDSSPDRDELVQPPPSPPTVTIPASPIPPTPDTELEPTPQPGEQAEGEAAPAAAPAPELELPPETPDLPVETPEVDTPTLPDLPGTPPLPEVPGLPVEPPPLPVDPPPLPPDEPLLGEPLVCADMEALGLDPPELCIP